MKNTLNRQSAVGTEDPGVNAAADELNSQAGEEWQEAALMDKHTHCCIPIPILPYYSAGPNTFSVKCSNAKTPGRPSASGPIMQYANQHTVPAHNPLHVPSTEHRQTTAQ